MKKGWIVIICFILIISCANTTRYDKVSDKVPCSEIAEFHYDNQGHIILDVAILDSVHCQSIFDTGCCGKLFIESDFAVLNGLIEDFIPNSTMRSVWNDKQEISYMRVPKPITINVGNYPIVYNEYSVLAKNTFNTHNTNVIFSIPPMNKDIWEINFEKRYVRLHNQEVVCNNSLTLSLEMRNGQFIIKDFPLSFQVQDSTIKHKITMHLDTGTQSSLVYLNTEPDSIMNFILNHPITQQHKCRSKDELQSSVLYRLAETEWMNRPVWIEHRKSTFPWKYVHSHSGIICGVDFLKSFNLYLYPYKNTIQLVPIAYIPIHEEKYSVNLRVFEDEKGNAVVEYIKSNFIPGIKAGDIILQMDKKNVFTLTKDYIKANRLNLSCEVVRGKDTLIIKRYNR